MKPYGFGLVTPTDLCDSHLVFETREKAQQYAEKRDTYFFKYNSRVVELFWRELDDLDGK